MNYVMIRRSGLTTTGQKNDWSTLMQEINGCLDSVLHNPQHDPVRRIFVSDGTGLMEYEVGEIRSEVAKLL